MRGTQARPEKGIFKLERSGDCCSARARHEREIAAGLRGIRAWL